VGHWATVFHEDYPERIPGPAIGDYVGLPINDAARLRGDAWSASLLTLPEHQCKPHPAAYGYRGPANMRITQDVDADTQALVRITVYIEWMEQHREIWMDSRPHPGPFSPHTWQGFSTGRWEDDTLVVTTTHLKAGWMRRNGLPYSDFATFTDRWTRYGDVLTHIAILEDPVYLTEPFVRTTNFTAAPTLALNPYPCESVTEIADRAPGDIPHHLPGENPMLSEYANAFSLPLDALRGGAETALPEFLDAGRTVPLPAGPATAARPAPAVNGVEIVPVQGNVYLLAGAGGNVAVQVGDDGVLVVDTGAAERSEALTAAIAELAGGRPVRWIVNTHAHGDHTGNNAAITTAGGVGAGDAVPSFDDGAVGGGLSINVVAHQAVLDHMSQDGAATPFAAWPTSTFTDGRKEIFFNGEGIELVHVPAAHTDGDVLVFFRRSDVVVAGDVFATTGYPRVHVDQGGSIDGEIAALNRLLNITLPRLKQEGGTYVIPGHGRVVDEADVVDYRDMVTIIRDRIRALRTRGLSLEQVQSERPTRDYDGRFAAADGAGSANMFVESVYESLSNLGESK
jgi:glyoxylase-like metal-dependent hydrolase (beta-lactamase superfamily II)